MCEIPPTEGRNGGGGTAGGGYLCLPLLEHSHIVYCKQARYGPLYVCRAENRDTGLQEVVGSGQGGCRGGP